MHLIKASYLLGETRLIEAINLFQPNDMICDLLYLCIDSFRMKMQYWFSSFGHLKTKIQMQFPIQNWEEINENKKHGFFSSVVVAVVSAYPIRITQNECTYRCI